MGRLTSFNDGAFPQILATDGLAGAEFSLAAARVTAWAAQLAYEATPPIGPAQPTILERMAGKWGWNNLQPITCDVTLGTNVRRAHGFVADGGSAQIVSFTGTEPDRFADWRIDLDVLRRGGNVSHGFDAALRRVWNDLVRRIDAGTGPLFIAGHSLGGAFAVLTARKLAAENQAAAARLRGVYTFGMPRVGNKAFAREYNGALDGRLGQCTYRLAHGGDFVSQVPPAGDGVMEFRHVGRGLHCGHGQLFAGAPALPALETSDGNLAGTLRMLDAAFADWDRLIDEFGDALHASLEARFNIALPTARRAPGPPFPARYEEAKGARFLLPAFRDHLMDRYLRAMGDRFPADRS